MPILCLLTVQPLHPLSESQHALGVQVQDKVSLSHQGGQKSWHHHLHVHPATTEEWDKITLDEIRKRIAEMPARCEKLVATGGERIRSKVW
jgi:hypothetical protein